MIDRGVKAGDSPTSLSRVSILETGNALVKCAKERKKVDGEWGCRGGGGGEGGGSGVRDSGGRGAKEYFKWNRLGGEGN